MFNSNGEPIRIVVETVPHEVVHRLDQTDAQLRAELNALRGMFSQLMDTFRELRHEVRELQSK